MSSLDELVALVERASGIVVKEHDRSHLEAIARARARISGCGDLSGYLKRLRARADDGEWRNLLSLVTVKESYLFRVPAQFEALARICLPDLQQRRGPDRPLRIWSAGCARGEEPATLAVVLAECRGLRACDGWRIVATDVDESALEEARRGIFGGRAMAAVPEELLERHFRWRGDELYELDQRLRRRIEYRPLNLVGDRLEMEGGPFDVVFFRNVLIYFKPEVQRRVVAAVANVMAADGYLFVGPSESLRGMVAGLSAVDLGGCFCYRWSASEPDRTSAPRRSRPGPGGAVSPGSGGGDDRPIVRAEPREGVSRHELAALAVQALSRGEAVAAHEMVEQGTRRHEEDPVLWALCGIIRERSGEDEEAVRCYRAALYLDPALIQVRHLLAVAMERLGWTRRARQEHQRVAEDVQRGRLRPLSHAADLGLPDVSELAERSSRALDEA